MKNPLPPGVHAHPTEPIYYQNKSGEVFRVESDGMTEVIPRYRIEVHYRGGGISQIADKNGEWVLYKDVAKFLPREK